MSNSYVRKTDNPNMGWSDERRAKYSAQCKEAHANGTRYKKSKKAVGLAISNGKKEAIKRKNRSEGQKRRHRASSAQVIKDILATPPPKKEEKLKDLVQSPSELLAKRLKADNQARANKIINAERVWEFEGEGALWDLKIRTIKDVRILFDLIEEHFGFQPSLNQFMEDAIGEKVAKFKEALCH